MLNRCRNPKSAAYANYGGRGIRVCKRWYDFPNFLADMGRRPAANLSLDRIDNDGNYEPANCRWATRAQQQANKRVGRVSKSGVKGVSWDQSKKKWIVRIFLGSFDDKAQAMRAHEIGERVYRAVLAQHAAAA